MSNGWTESAPGWLAAMGDTGDWGRVHVLDPAMLERVAHRPYRRMLDVGCGEGRFCRMMQSRGIATVGIDPTEPLLSAAKARDPSGEYHLARGENLPFPDAAFDLVVSYLTLIDIADYRRALAEMVRVLEPGGTLLIANLNGFITSRPHGWIRDADGNALHYPVDDYLAEHADTITFSSGIRIENWHRPLSAYMSECLDLGLALTHFDEPAPVSGEPDRQARYGRAPWFHVIEWRR